jgi:hypothetical protein
MTHKKVKLYPLIFVLAALFTFTACQGSANSTATPETPAITPEDGEPSSTLPSEETTEMMYRLLELSAGSEISAVIDDIVAEGDTSFIPVFIELMRANQIGLLPFTTYSLHIEALEAMSGETFGDDYPGLNGTARQLFSLLLDSLDGKGNYWAVSIQDLKNFSRMTLQAPSV